MLEVESSSNPVAPNPTQIELTINGQAVALAPQLVTRYLKICYPNISLPEATAQIIKNDCQRNTAFSSESLQMLDYGDQTLEVLVETQYLLTQEMIDEFEMEASPELEEIVSKSLQAQQAQYDKEGGHAGVLEKRAQFIAANTSQGKDDDFLAKEREENERLAVHLIPLKKFQPLDRLLVDHPSLVGQYQQGITGTTQSLLAAASNFQVDLPKYSPPKTPTRTAKLTVMPDGTLKTTMDIFVELKGPNTDLTTAAAPFWYKEQARIAFQDNRVKIDVQLMSHAGEALSDSFFIAALGYNLTKWCSFQDIKQLIHKIEAIELKRALVYEAGYEHSRLIIEAMLTALRAYRDFFKSEVSIEGTEHLPLSFVFNHLLECLNASEVTLATLSSNPNAFLSYERNPIIRTLLLYGDSPIKRMLLESDKTFNMLFITGLMHVREPGFQGTTVIAPMLLETETFENLAYIEACSLVFSNTPSRIKRLTQCAQDWHKAYKEYLQESSGGGEQRLIAKYIGLLQASQAAQKDFSNLKQMPCPIKKLLKKKIQQTSKALEKQLVELIKEQPQFEEVVIGKLGESSRCWKLSKPRCVP